VSAVEDPHEALGVVNVGEAGVTLGQLLDGAARSLEHLDVFRHDTHGQEQFKTSDGRWWLVTYAAHLTAVDCPTCDECAEDVLPDDIGRDGPDRVICKSCLARR
jgi:hypothetical protein